MGIPAFNNMESTGRSPVAVPSMFSESMPTQETPASPERLGRRSAQVRVCLEIPIGAGVRRVVGPNQHCLPGEPAEILAPY